MPDINPLTNNQIFLKKISENTGSDYETGDVSEINPLTIDQIFLKEIAANTAGQAGDITELEEKVTANTAAIEAIVSENGCCNILPNNAVTATHENVTFIVNDDGSITANGSTTNAVKYVTLIQDLSLKAGTYVVSSGLPNINYGLSVAINHVEIAVTVNDKGMTTFILNSDSVVSVAAVVGLNTTVNNETIYPMLYDARLNPSGYVPYAMTNRELTDAVNRGSVSVTADGVKTYSQLFDELFNLAELSKIKKGSEVYLNNRYWQLSFTDSDYYLFSNTMVMSGEIYMGSIHLLSNLSTFDAWILNSSGNSHTSLGSEVPSSGKVITLYY